MLCLVLLAISIGVWRDVTYWKEFRAFKKTVRAYDLKIVGEWWYDEDFVLESFGVKVATESSQFWVDYLYPTTISDANTPIKGILVMHEEGVKTKAFAVESPFWKSEQLPETATFGDFLRNADAIVTKLQKAKVRSFEYEEENWQNFRQYVIIRFNDEPGNPNQTQ
jgi:hypothetical protein